MNIKNISAKIVNIGSKIVMPDDVVTVNEDIANLPSVQALIRANVLQDMSVPAKEDEEFNARVLEVAKKLVEEQNAAKAEEKPKKRGRKSTKAATEEVATAEVENAEIAAEE